MVEETNKPDAQSSQPTKSAELKDSQKQDFVEEPTDLTENLDAEGQVPAASGAPISEKTAANDKQESGQELNEDRSGEQGLSQPGHPKAILDQLDQEASSGISESENTPDASVPEPPESREEQPSVEENPADPAGSPEEDPGSHPGAEELVTKAMRSLDKLLTSIKSQNSSPKSD